MIKVVISKKLICKVLERMIYVEGQSNYEGVCIDLRVIDGVINEELFYRVLDQNNFEVNAVDLRVIDGKIYAESLCVNEYGAAWGNNDRQEINLDRETLDEVLSIMGEDNFVRIYKE